MRSRKAAFIALFMLSVAVLSLFVLIPSKSNPRFPGTTTVKLYSGNNLAATWLNANTGRVEGNVYIFTLPDNQDREVRISGTYSVEVVR